MSLALVFLVGSAATAAPGEQQWIVPGGGATKTVSRGGRVMTRRKGDR
jgi:hypothetical protein